MSSRKGRIVVLSCTWAMGCLLVWFARANEPAKPKEWDFDQDKIGEIGRGFSGESGEWKIVADETAPSKGQVLAQLARSEGAAFNLALVKDIKAKQLELSVKFKAVAGKEDQGGGVVWRAKDAKNYFLCRYNPLEENLRAYKIVDGKRTILESVDIEHTEGWHTLRVTTRDERITLFLDGEPRSSFLNDSFKDAGMIGLWTKADAQTHFDDLIFIEYQ